MKYNDPWWTCTHSIYLKGNNRLSVLVCVCVDGAIELFLQLMPSEVDYDATLRYHHMAAAEENSKKMRPRCNFGRTSPEKKNSLRAAHNSIPIKMRAAHDTGHKRNNETGALKVGQLKFSSVLPAARCQLSGSFTAKIFRTNNNALMTASFPDNFNTYGYTAQSFT